MLDAKLLTSMCAEVAKEQAKIYGSVFSRLVALHSVKFLANVLRETPPDVLSLDDATRYIALNLNRYRRGYAAFAYGAGKAVSMLEGNIGAGATLFSKLFLKNAMNKSGVVGATNHVSGTGAALNKYGKLLQAINLTEEGMGSVTGDGSEATVRVSGCAYVDACRRISKEGLTRAVGGKACIWATWLLSGAEAFTERQHDYRMAKLEPPNCEITIFKQK